jgi:hypothetical protein
MALSQLPRIVELEADESHVVQDLDTDSHQNKPESLDWQITLADLRTGSPHTALVSLDPWTHQILDGLSHWCDAQVNFPFTREEGTGSNGVHLIQNLINELEKGESEQMWRRLAEVCSVETMLVTLRRTGSLLHLLARFICNRLLDGELAEESRSGYACMKSRIFQFFCQRTVKILGPQHPVTLLCVQLAHGLPLTALLDIMNGIYQIHTQRESIIRRRRLGELLSGLTFVTTRGQSLFSLHWVIGKGLTKDTVSIHGHM